MRNDRSFTALAPRSLACVASLAATLAVGCQAAPLSHTHAEDAHATAEARPLLELFSWWTAPGEAEALQALVNTHEAAHPKARVFNAAAASGQSAKSILHRRLEGQDPPDLFQENIHDLRTSISEGAAKVEPLDDLFRAVHADKTFVPEVIDDVTMNGHVVAMPVNLHRENSVFYNVHVFERLHIAPPKTVPELLDACRTIKAAGIAPIATAYQGWILRIMFESIAAGTLGADEYRAYFSGNKPGDVQRLREAFIVFKEILENYVNDDASEDGFGWTNAAAELHTGDAAMFMHGDWAKGYLQQLGARPAVDFGVVASPGAQDFFLYGVDVFAVPEGAPNAAGARQFLETIASEKGQVAFNRIKGSSPIRVDAQTESFDALGKETLRDLREARVRMRVRSVRAWDDAFVQFAKTKDVDAIVKVFVDNPPTE